MYNNQLAIDDYTSAIKIDPNNGYAYYMRGQNHFFLGQEEKGCLDLSKAATLGVSGAAESFEKFCN